MKAWSIIWGIVAATCLVVALTGATHHFWTFGISTAMCFAFAEESKEEDADHERR